MSSDFNIDFSDKIKANEVDKLTYQGPDGFPGEDKREFKYLKLNIKELLDFPPPANSSKQTLNELLEVKKITELEHPESFTSKLEEMDKEPYAFVYDYYEKISGKSLPKKALQIINSGDIETFVMKLKLHYNRPRPHELALHYKKYLKYNKKIASKSGTAASPSYPSGHTMAAYFAAHIGAHIRPDLKEQLIKRADFVAYSRLYEGLHFRSDNDFSIYLVEKVLMPAFLKAI